jgi:hypothetical protein
MMRAPTVAAPVRPYESILICPLCGEWLHRHHPDDVFDNAEAEAAVEMHFRDVHPRRWWLYERTGWTTPLRGLFG